MTKSKGSLDFLKDKASVYYTALDTEAFPEWDRRSKQIISISDQIVFLKALSLLVEHIVIPPSYLVRLLDSTESATAIRKMIGDYIESGTILTTVYQGMTSPIDFVEMKASSGDSREQHEFGGKLRSARELYGSMPLFHRNVSKQVTDYKARIISQIASSNRLKDSAKTQLLMSLNNEEQNSDLSFGRTLIVNAIKKANLSTSEYRAAYYIMSTEYYRGGAISSNSDISCVNVHEFSVLGKDIFQQSENCIVVGYDPKIFLYVLECHSISRNCISTLSYPEIEELRSHPIFSEFIKQYQCLISSVQKLELVGRGFGREHLHKLRYKIASEILSRYKVEERFYGSLLRKEDFGVAIALGALGFFLGGPIGASILASLGFSHPLLRKLSTSPVEYITSKIEKHKISFYMYLQHLEEVVTNYET